MAGDQNRAPTAGHRNRIFARAWFPAQQQQPRPDQLDPQLGAPGSAGVNRGQPLAAIPRPVSQSLTAALWNPMEGPAPRSRASSPAFASIHDYTLFHRLARLELPLVAALARRHRACGGCGSRAPWPAVARCPGGRIPALIAFSAIPPPPRPAGDAQLVWKSTQMAARRLKLPWGPGGAKKKPPAPRGGARGPQVIFFFFFFLFFLLYEQGQIPLWAGHDRPAGCLRNLGGNHQSSAGMLDRRALKTAPTCAPSRPPSSLAIRAGRGNTNTRGLLAR